MVGWLVGWVLWHINLCSSCQIHFHTNNQFYFKQFSLTWVHSLIDKNISISNYSVYSNNSNSANFVFTQLDVKTVLYITIQFNVSRVSMSKTIPFLTIHFSISTQFKCKYSFNVKKFNFKQFSSAQACILNISTISLRKTILLLAIQFSQAVQIQLIQLRISTDFVYTVKKVLY